LQQQSKTMAGAIFISSELRLPVSTRQFDYFVERFRGAFLPEEQHDPRCAD
jgi:hypothetical protein